jgi:hypothetical protein
VTILALVVAVIALAIVLAERRRNRIARQWLAERQRLERYGEHLAASNGHPHTGNVVTVVPVNGYDTPPPEEVA